MKKKCWENTKWMSAEEERLGEEVKVRNGG